MHKPLSAAEVRVHASLLRASPPEAILGWAIASFPGRFALSVSFGGAGVVLAHMLSTIDRRVPVIFLNTGYLFEETLAFRADFAARYGLNVIDVEPEHDPGPLYLTDPDGCCDIRKVKPMTRVLHGYDAWASAIRRDQGGTRANTEVLEYHETDGRPLVRVHPLAYWSRADVWSYISTHAVPSHPLLDAGYTSLGCWPCTRKTAAGESERAGRWSGSAKTECGLHTALRSEPVVVLREQRDRRTRTSQQQEQVLRFAQDDKV
jgi:phosphoadenosine phosphosulfate reductase